ncbi:MAG: hypothetical protein QXE73_05220 [Candidatus Bathyarchaeia archaeon]
MAIITFGRLRAYSVTFFTLITPAIFTPQWHTYTPILTPSALAPPRKLALHHHPAFSITTI